MNRAYLQDGTAITRGDDTPKGRVMDFELDLNNQPIVRLMDPKGKVTFSSVYPAAPARPVPTEKPKPKPKAPKTAVSGTTPTQVIVDEVEPAPQPAEG